MPEPIKLPPAHPLVKRLLAATFPEYRGRRIYLERADHPVDVRSYWDGGRRSYFVAVDLRTLRTVSIPQNGTPYDGGAIAPAGVTVPPDRAIVEHLIAGQYQAVYVHVATTAKLDESPLRAALADGSAA
jgi:hypothetical protein